VVRNNHKKIKNIIKELIVGVEIGPLIEYHMQNLRNLGL
jgi:hypothetical protein